MVCSRLARGSRLLEVQPRRLLRFELCETHHTLVCLQTDQAVSPGVFRCRGFGRGRLCAIYLNVTDNPSVVALQSMTGELGCPLQGYNAAGQGRYRGRDGRAIERQTCLRQARARRVVDSQAI